MSKPEFALDYIQRELRQTGRSVGMHFISERHPVRYLSEKSANLKLWEWGKTKTLALETKGNTLQIYYDSRDKELSEVVLKAKEVFEGLEATVRNW